MKLLADALAPNIVGMKCVHNGLSVWTRSDLADWPLHEEMEGNAELALSIALLPALLPAPAAARGRR